MLLLTDAPTTLPNMQHGATGTFTEAILLDGNVFKSLTLAGRNSVNDASCTHKRIASHASDSSPCLRRTLKKPQLVSCAHLADKHSPLFKPFR
jgi:hypothetical protein